MIDLMALQPKPVIELPEPFAFHRLRKMLQQVYHGAVIFYRPVLKRAAADLQYPTRLADVFRPLATKFFYDPPFIARL